jgi:hypothetical protein
MPEPDADLAVRTLRFLDQAGASAMRVHRIAHLRRAAGLVTTNAVGVAPL